MCHFYSGDNWAGRRVQADQDAHEHPLLGKNVDVPAGGKCGGHTAQCGKANIHHAVVYRAVCNEHKEGGCSRKDGLPNIKISVHFHHRNMWQTEK